MGNMAAVVWPRSGSLPGSGSGDTEPAAGSREAQSFRSLCPAAVVLPGSEVPRRLLSLTLLTARGCGLRAAPAVTAEGFFEVQPSQPCTPWARQHQACG